jgi:hypothetical protein
MTSSQIRYPLVNMDFRSKTLGEFMIRYCPGRAELEYPDGRGGYGGEGYTVRDFVSSGPLMLQRDMNIRVKLAELGYGFDQLARLDNMLLADTPLTEGVMDSLSAGGRRRLSEQVRMHDEVLSEPVGGREDSAEIVSAFNGGM